MIVELALYVYVLPVLLLGIIVFPLLIRDHIRETVQTVKFPRSPRLIDTIGEVAMNVFMIVVELAVFISFCVITYQIVFLVLGLFN